MEKYRIYKQTGGYYTRYSVRKKYKYWPFWMTVGEGFFNLEDARKFVHLHAKGFLIEVVLTGEKECDG